MAPRSGVLVVDKPAGPTSHDVVERVRRALGSPRVGHTGTLDPFATGVLVVCVGRATRLARFLAEGEKEYAATVRLGFATTTDDLEGEPLGPPRPVSTDAVALEAAVRALLGPLEQVPPAYSAKRVAGRRLYELARRGERVAPAPVQVRVEELRIRAVREDEVDLFVRCSPGTYVRALARDLGLRLGVGGHLRALRRLATGGFTLDDAVAGDAIDAGSWTRLVPLDRLLPQMPAVRLRPSGVTAARHGRSLGPADVEAGFPEEAPGGHVRLLEPGGGLLGLAQLRAPDGSGAVRLHPAIVLVE
jgi:tRNA pseudouridine55 synthase